MDGMEGWMDEGMDGIRGNRSAVTDLKKKR